VSDVDLDLIEARAAAATPGPWFPKNDSEYSYGVTYREDPTKQVLESGERLIADCAFSDEEHNNYIFIAHARTDVSALINRVRELEAALDRAAELLGGAMERAVDAEATIERAKKQTARRRVTISGDAWHDGWNTAMAQIDAALAHEAKP